MKVTRHTKLNELRALWGIPNRWVYVQPRPVTMAELDERLSMTSDEFREYVREKCSMVGWYPGPTYGPPAPTTEPEMPAATPIPVTPKTEYGAHCIRCNDFCPDAERIENFKCFRCRT